MDLLNILGTVMGGFLAVSTNKSLPAPRRGYLSNSHDVNYGVAQYGGHMKLITTEGDFVRDLDIAPLVRSKN
jgi:hypothetical protein